MIPTKRSICLHKRTRLIPAVLTVSLLWGQALPAWAAGDPLGGPGVSSGSGTSPGPGASAGPGTSAGPGVSSGWESSSGGGSASSDRTDSWQYRDGYYRMPDGSAIRGVTARGIDVSRWQGEVDWQQAAADDVSFVMLGTRSRGETDPYFHQNIRGAAEAGISVGVYIYSLAVTPQMAEEEAEFVLNLIKDYPVSYPVAFDMEDDVQAALSPEQLAEIADAFCSRIAQAGYYPIIYANEYWLNNVLDMSLMDYPVWVARYGTRPSYSGVLWQASNTGRVAGIDGNVDINFQFVDFVERIPSDLWRTIGGNRYYYDDYVLQKDTWIYDGDAWYYMNADGLADTGWMEEGGKLYYLDEEDGKMKYGWKDRDGSWYYLGSSGAASSGWVSDGGQWYYLDPDTCRMETGWIEDRGSRYYLEGDGRMYTGWLEQNGFWYYFGSSGAMTAGWVQDGGSWYYTGADGQMRTGWQQVGDIWYLLGGDGRMETGWQQTGGTWYYLEDSGAMATGWKQIDGIWYYLQENGAMAEGLVELDGVRYYLEPGSGRMLANGTVELDGARWTAGADGALTLEAAAE